MSDKPYIVVESRKSGVEAVKLTSGPFSGIIFSYGKVSFEEINDGVDDTCKMNFEYDVHEDAGVTYKTEEFEMYIGELLKFIILEELQNNSISYTGGIDEN
jgi:hypothetical protein